MSNRRNNQFMYNPHNKATVLDCNFSVDSSNASGIASLNASGRIKSVFMHTSTTPAAGNPNPANGLIIVNLQDNYNSYYGGYSASSVAVTGSAINSGLSVGNVYQIVSLGTTTAAQWVTGGLAVGVTAAVGVSFIAAATSFSGTGTVKAVKYAGFSHVELVGNPNLMNNNGAQIAGSGQGMQLIFACYGPSAALTMNSYTPAGTVAAPVLTMDSYTPAGVITNGTPDTFAGTPAVLTGTNSAPAFTGSAATLTGSVALSYALAAPVDGCKISLNLYLNDSAQGV